MNLVPRAEIESVGIIRDFIRDRMSTSGSEIAVLGLSGGLDSTLVLKLLVDALGSDRVRAFFLPYGGMNPEDRHFAALAASFGGVKLEVMDIAPMVDAVPLDLHGMAKGNAMARSRMVVLYALANTMNGLVAGTSNKSELLTGYFTKYGDGAADIYPIGDLFKTQVRAHSAALSLPRAILDRPPSAGLVAGQTDEGDLRLPYPILDQVLNGLVRGHSVEAIADSVDHTVMTVDELDRSGFEPPVSTEQVIRVRSMMRASRHKRLSLQVPKLGPYTVGIDHRERL